VSRTLRSDNITVGIDTLEEGGVKQTRTTVNYRFSQPDQPMPILVTQSYGGRDTSWCEDAGDAPGSSADKSGTIAEGSGSPDRCGPEHAGEVGAGATGAEWPST